MVLTAIRRVLSRRLSVAAVTEIALVLAIPHLLIGIGWAITHPDYEAQRGKQLSRIFNQGVDGQLVALGETAVWWPVLILLPSDLCTPES
jgi:hypothetical protein